ncbi:MAG: hypothetical protein IPM25_04755 [Chloracidobacterium sp.]|nr:hypothetical protein [Chloracidobacterium sp.]
MLGSGSNVGAGNLTFATAIGAGATVSNNNSVVLGRVADTVRIPGNLIVNGTFTAPSFTLPATNITGTLGTANGGTGLNSAGTAGNFLRSNGSTWMSQALVAGDIPSGSTHYIQNGVLQQAGVSFNVGGNGTIGGNLSVGGTITGAFNVPASNITGVLGFANGGTGVSSPGVVGNVLRSNGTNWTSAPLMAADIPSLASSYVQNTTTQQVGANFNIGGNGTIGGNLTVTGVFNGSVAASNVSGIVAVTNGGTGLNSAGTSGHFLKSTGAGFTTAALAFGDIPDLSTGYIQNGVVPQSGANFNIAGNGTVGTNLTVGGNLNVGGSLTGAFTIPAANITGILGTANGGTGVNAAGTAGNFLRSNGSIWQSQALVAGDIPSGSTHYVQNGVAAADFNIGGTWRQPRLDLALRSEHQRSRRNTGTESAVTLVVDGNRDGSTGTHCKTGTFQLGGPALMVTGTRSAPANWNLGYGKWRHRTGLIDYHPVPPGRRRRRLDKRVDHYRRPAKPERSIHSESNDASGSQQFQYLRRRHRRRNFNGKRRQCADPLQHKRVSRSRDDRHEQHLRGNRFWQFEYRKLEFIHRHKRRRFEYFRQFEHFNRSRRRRFNRHPDECDRDRGQGVG